MCALQDYFQAQSRHTQLTYEVKQLRKRKETLMQHLQEHWPQCHRSNKIPNLINRRPLIAADSSGFSAFVVAEPNGALQVLHLNNLVGHRSEVPIVASADVGTVPLPSKIESVGSVSESRDSRVVHIEPVNGELKLVSEPGEQIVKETELSDDGSIIMGDCENGENVDAEESNTEEELCAPENGSSRNGSPSSIATTEIADAAASNRITKETGKSMVSQDYQTVKPVHNGMKRGSRPAEVSKRVATTADSIISQVPLVVTALSADED